MCSISTGISKAVCLIAMTMVINKQDKMEHHYWTKHMVTFKVKSKASVAQSVHVCIIAS